MKRVEISTRLAVRTSSVKTSLICSTEQDSISCDILFSLAIEMTCGIHAHEA